jgi:hypothetical protein
MDSANEPRSGDFNVNANNCVMLRFIPLLSGLACGDWVGGSDFLAP